MFLYQCLLCISSIIAVSVVECFVISAVITGYRQHTAGRCHFDHKGFQDVKSKYHAERYQMLLRILSCTNKRPAELTDPFQLYWNKIFFVLFTPISFYIFIAYMLRRYIFNRRIWKICQKKIQKFNYW